MPSAVIDLNVFISGMLFGGKAGAVIDFWVEGYFELVASAAFLDQLEQILKRPKFMTIWPNDRGERIIGALRAGALIDEPALDLRLCRDPDDDALLNLAASAACSFLVTGDKDLLDDDNLKEVMLQQHGVQILNPNDFLALLEAQP